ncbi:hypothetical protein DPEC_G00150160 [Dallia pectoralis]|uniref:Uncharacterized protein n=1 Tax=Dallia pectoralis TaxID=75939 RepID=A0ACC2GIP8_DALPE|nr:hypothetical protein DPEC_G00150160 [Dallia pectoralis]
MATECIQEAVLQFLVAHGGRVTNQELIDRFKAIFPEDAEQKAIVRGKFKGYVDTVAFVKLENGVKYVCLKKKYQRSCSDHARTGTGTPVVSKAVKNLKEYEEQRVSLAEFAAENVISNETIADEEEQQEMSPDSGTFKVSGARPTDISGNNLDGKTAVRTESTLSVFPNNGPLDNNINALGVGVFEAKLTRGYLQTLPQPQTTHRDCRAGDPSFDREPAASPGVMPQVDNPRSPSESLNSPVSETGGDESPYYDLPLGTCGSDSPTTKGSPTPQVRRSRMLRTSVYLSAKHRDSAKSDSDVVSQASSTTDEDDAGSVALDPLEHEWMMCASNGQWGSLNRLLSCEPNLITKKDFVTGFTCLHWAAKQGRQELLALMVNFAKQHMVPININARSSAGYTPLHLAVMHNHVEVVKLLVGAYDADVEARDFNGKKPCQYLTNGVARDIRDIVGEGCTYSDTENTDNADGGRWRLSKVLQSSLPLKLLNQGEEDTCDGASQARQKPVRRKSSLSKMKPKLQKIRFRSSQIVHSASFTSHREVEELEGSSKSSSKSRPMSSLFG